MAEIRIQWVKHLALCSTCGRRLRRFIYRPKDGARILHFFCDRACKGQWQRKQRESLGFTREWLYQKYIVERLDCVQIAAIVGRNPKQVWHWIRDYGIPTRPRGGNTSPHAFKKGGPNLFAGRRHSLETREKLRAIALADGRVPFNPAIGPPYRGKRGSDTSNWKGGITPDRQAFYASDEWKRACRAVWARANARCEKCNIDHNDVLNRGTFHVHHVVSFAVKEFRAVLNNLVLLCRSCHRFVHSRANIERQFLGGL